MVFHSQERNVYIFYNLDMKSTCSKTPINHPYQLIFNAGNNAIICPGEKIDIKYNFVRIAKIESMLRGDYVGKLFKHFVVYTVCSL